jgi:hypothetical protein
LLASAVKYGRQEEFREELGAWSERKKLDLRDENRQRRSSDREELTGDKLWPQKYITTSLLASWKDGITTGRWNSPRFRFQASIEEDTDSGRKQLKVDSLSRYVDTLTAKDIAKVYKRFYTLTEELLPVLLDKRQREQSASPKSRGKASDAASRKLAEVGLADLIDDDDDEIDGDDDPDFDADEERDEQDLTSTAELPDGPQAERGEA